MPLRRIILQPVIQTHTSTVCSGTDFTLANAAGTTAGSYLKVDINDPDNLIGGSSTTYVLATSYNRNSIN